MDKWWQGARVSVLVGCGLLAGLVGSSEALAQSGARRVALVIGNARYQHADVLPSAARDAQRVASALEGLDFQVALLENVPQSQLAGAITAFQGAKKLAEVALFYYSGRAVQVDGKNYLVPIDAELATASAVDTQGVDTAALVAPLPEGGPALNVVLLDANHQNPWAPGWPVRSRAWVPRGLSEIAPTTPGTVVGYSAAPSTAEADPGAWADALIRQLQRPCFSVGTALELASDEVAARTSEAQAPWVYTHRAPETSVAQASCDADLVPMLMNTVPQRDPSEPEEAGGLVLNAKGKPPAKFVDQVLTYTKDVSVVLQPPVSLPSPAAGSFVRPYAPKRSEDIDEQRIGTYDTIKSSCSRHLIFADQELASPDTYEALVTLPSGIAEGFDVPVPNLGGAARHRAIAGLQYEVMGKRVLVGGQEALARCCLQRPAECSEEIISEWWQGVGRIYQINASKAGVKYLAGALEEAKGALHAKVREGMVLNNEWRAPAYFAYEVQRLVLPRCSEYLDAAVRPSSDLVFAGTSQQVGDETEARQGAARDAELRLVDMLTRDHGVRPGRATTVAAALITDVFETFICVDENLAGPAPLFQGQARMTVAKERFQASLAEIMGPNRP